MNYNIYVCTLNNQSTNSRCAETVQATSVAYGKQRRPQSRRCLDLVRGFQERGWMKWTTKPTIFLSSCWALCALCVPFLWVTSNKPLRHAREWKWEFGVHGLSCLNLSPWSDSTNSLLPFALSWFSTRVCFPQPDGKMHNLLHHRIYCETNCFPNVWNQYKQNQQAWLVVYWKHGFLCAVSASCMMWDSGPCKKMLKQFAIFP